MGFHWPYFERPPANRSAARAAWDSFVAQEAGPRQRYAYGNAGTRGVATALPLEPPQQRTPFRMTYRHMDYWVWVMEFTNGEFEEIDALECRRNQ